ncbi:MAG TPA: patatin-like phospholipase family protein, partial [Anaeromyxobacteraceae bacterium]|nr:patatin-like phospholipase family protein [Anaeromyxobacteraceae bacterium]
MTRRPARPLRSTSGLAAVAAVALLVLAPAAGARAAGVAPESAAVTVSGGVSLGAYEAGFLYYTLATIREDPNVELKLLTGASAGGLNALLSLLSACGGEARTPADSLLWKLWIPVGFDRLHVPGASTRLSVFSREWLEQEGARIEEEWNRGIDAECDVVLGVSTTRVKPRSLRTAGGALELPRMEEKFAVRIQGRGPGRPPRATNYVDASRPPEEAILVTDASGEIPFSELQDLLIASMSFPVAFPPAVLRTCTSAATARAGVCLPAEADEALYVDGGVFDNAPLRFAVQLAADGLRAVEGEGAEWQEVPDRAGDALPPEMAFAVLDPDATEYPVPREREAVAETASIAALVGTLGVGFLDTARSKELLTLVEEHPEIAHGVLLPRRHFPAASAPLVAFLGFFEAEFRTFDFHLGMYDAWKMLERQVEAREEGRLRYPEPPGATGDGGVGGWAPLACLRAVYDGVGSAADACGSADLADFRALLQLSLDGLYSACREVDEKDGAFPWRSAHCRRAAAGEPPPVVPGVRAVEARGDGGWKREANEREIAYTMRLLGAYGFRFRDLGVPPGRGDLALERIRTKLGSAARALADAQPESHRAAVGRAGKLVADFVAYSAP